MCATGQAGRRSDLSWYCSLVRIMGPGGHVPLHRSSWLAPHNRTYVLAGRLAAAQDTPVGAAPTGAGYLCYSGPQACSSGPNVRTQLEQPADCCLPEARLLPRLLQS